jgi:hypothetical protein
MAVEGPLMLGNRIIINIHVPKTAGSTFGHLMRNVCRSIGRVDLYANIHLGLGVQPDEQYDAALVRHLTLYLAQLPPDRPAILTGHFSLSDIIPVIAPLGDRIGLVTFLRDPVDRCISDYNYCLTDKHPGHESFRRQFPTLADFLVNPASVNKHMTHLRPHAGATVEETAAYLRDRFLFIGQTARFDQDFARLCGTLGLPKVPPLRVNVGPERGESGEIDSAMRARVAAAVAADIALCRAVTARIDAGAGVDCGSVRHMTEDVIKPSDQFTRST